MKRMPTRSAELAVSSAGAHTEGAGVTFTLDSRTATAVELCWFDDAEREQRLAMDRLDAQRWHVHVAQARVGTAYGFRVHGPWEPQVGHFHNPHKLLLDPYACAVSGPLVFDPLQTCWESVDGRLLPDARDSVSVGLRSVVTDERFDWQDDRAPRVPWSDTVIYECHVKGMTMRHPRVAEDVRGRYLGLCAVPVIEHLQALGVTTLSLLPIATSYTERRLVDAGLTNHWGYQPIASMAPTWRYASMPGREGHELKQMVRQLHAAGIEVLLDIVLNHTGEGPSVGIAAGPLIGMRGIDRGYFRRHVSSPGLDVDYTGCGNSLDFGDPLCVQWALATFRHWALAYHVDGFRLDLAPVLGRAREGFSASATLWRAIDEDPVLRALKWIAEPWDLGPDGYCVGRFPPSMFEWNDRFRDASRRYARGDRGTRAELATRLAGSADLFGAREQDLLRSVHYVTAHDGFTLRDLVSYERKRNEGNGEQNRDGRDENFSASWGCEGPSDDAQVNETRRRVASMLLTTLAVAQGVPMLCHGDELGRSQYGNNNAYCQDNDLSYVRWVHDRWGAALHDLVRALFALRREHLSLRAMHPRHGERVPGLGLPDLGWLAADGTWLQPRDWDDPEALVLGMWRCAALSRDRFDLVLCLWNPTAQAVPIQLPQVPLSGAWTLRIDTAEVKQAPRACDARSQWLPERATWVLTWDVRS